MELAKTDYTASDCKEPELNEALRMIERRDDEIARLHTELATLRADLETLHTANSDNENALLLARLREEMEALRTINADNALLFNDIRLPLFRLLKDQLGAMVSGEIAEQLKTKETAFDITDYFDEIREDITYNFDISSFQSEIEEIVTERDITDEVTEIVEDVLRGAKITIG